MIVFKYKLELIVAVNNIWWGTQSILKLNLANNL